MFFPTKEVTGLNFIIHAPFLLTDSLEGIKAAVPHNKKMVALLAELAADSLVYLKEIGQAQGINLIDGNVFDIIPYNEYSFNDVNDRSKISFKPFYIAIKEKLSNEQLLPSSDGFVACKNAYWAFVPQIPEVFSNNQLAFLIDNENAKWAFTSFGRQETLRTNRELSDYIDSITQDWFNEDKLIGRITSEFIKAQPIEWLQKLYKYVAETSGRTKLIKTKPIFLNQDSKAVSAFDSNGQAILFLPSDDVSGYETVNATLLENDDTIEFIGQLGIKKPSLRDEIYNIILPRYQDVKAIDTAPHFLKFFKYYKECPQTEVDEYIELIKDYKFVSYRSADDDVVYRGKASELYLPTEDLLKYFKSKSNTRFVELDRYKSLVGKSNEKYLIIFLNELGVRNEPNVVERELNYQEAHQIRTNWEYSSGYKKWTEHYLDGCKEIIEFIIDSHDSDLSLVLWEQLLEIITSKCSRWQSLDRILCGDYRYFYYFARCDRFDSSDSIRLRTKSWLLNSDNEFVSADKLTLQTLSPLYNTTSEGAQELLQFLGIQEEVIEGETDNLTDEQRRKIELANKIEAEDISPEELDLFLQQRRLKKQNIHSHTESPISAVSSTNEDDSESIEVLINSTVSRVAKEVTKRAVYSRAPIENQNSDDTEDLLVSDEDEYTKLPVDYSKKIEQAKQRSANEIQKIAYFEELQELALRCEKYSFGWFKALLELETLNSGESNANSKEISISFAKVERETGTSRILILKHPNRYIPQLMEDLADIPLVLHYGNQTKTVAVEVVNVKSYTLRAKLKTNAEIDGIDLSLVTEAKIEAKNPVFLLEELRKQFNRLVLDDDYNLQKNLCENIAFIFGPPGTGKTTHLAREVLLPIMRKPEDLKVLVLTPTNKAADVLVSRVMEIMGQDTSYNNWLVRFGATNDYAIEQSGVYRDKTFDIRTFPRNVTVTTIARFPYDYFMPHENTRLHLNALKWDCIVIDEASMIPLVNIIFPLYKKTPQKFIIAGDPFQIEPITSVDLWKNENIYTMVELSSFTQPTTIPHQYHVELLTTQYRSVPAIGEVFSRFTYDGVLCHNRTTDSQRKLRI